MRKSWVLIAVAIGLSLAGTYLSGALLSKHMKTGDTPAWLNSACESSSGNVSCDAVLSSRWGVFPPLPEGETDASGRWPVSLLGQGYFTFLLVWYVVVGRTRGRGRAWHLVPTVVTAFGLAASTGFVWVMASELGKWCPLCVATHAINLSLFVTNLLLWPRKTSGDRKASESEVAYPTPGRVAASVVIGLLLFNTQYKGAINTGLARANKVLIAQVEEIQKNERLLVSMYSKGEKKDIVVRPDDPVRHGGAGHARMVIWSDFECGFCKSFAEDFEKKYIKDFGGNLEVVYKHYPLGTDCNPYVRRNMHPDACQAARLAEAARMQGGSEKFWEAHDLLFASQKKLGQLDPRAFADELGLDADRLVADAESDVVKKRITEDVDQAKRLGVRSTPAIFLSGRAVSGLQRGVAGFWRRVGSAYRKAAKGSHNKHRHHNHKAGATRDP
jgi:protein-disulfide isomerase/uncharacterized membrane protein